MTDLLLQPTGNPSLYEVIANEHIVGRIALSECRSRSGRRFPQLDLVALGIEDPAELAVLRLVRAVDGRTCMPTRGLGGSARTTPRSVSLCTYW